MPRHKTIRPLLRIATLLALCATFPHLARAAGVPAEKELEQYAPVLPSTLERAWALDPDRGLARREVAENVYVVTDGVWQSVFVVTGTGVVVFDAPESYGGKLQSEVAAVTDQPIRRLVYTHAHRDHIGGAGALAEIEGLEILALDGVGEFLSEKNDPNRPAPTRTFADELILEEGGMRIELRGANYHSDGGDLIVYIPEARFLMAIDTLAPGYVPFMGFDLTSNFHEYRKVFDQLLAYDFDTFVGGHLTHTGTRADVEQTREFTRDVYETVKRVHAATDLMTVFQETAQAIGGFDNKYLLFQRFLDIVIERSTTEIEERWKNRLAGVDVWTRDHVRTALVYVRWDD
jgi:glyoxylase-like metal-dependent hydrolase (beta-lactamase superfamily II)